MIRRGNEKLLARLGSRFVEMNVRLWLVDGARKTLFCLHGFINNSADFIPLAEALAADGYNVICPDLPGRGLSAGFHDPDSYGLRNMQQCVAYVVDRYATPANAVLGASWGGSLAMQLAALGRERIGAVILNDMPLVTRENGQARDYRRFLQDVCERIEPTHGQATAWISELLDANMGPFSGDVRDQLASHYVTARGAGFGFAVDAALAPAMERLAGDHDLRAHVRAMGRPVLMLYGERSRFRDLDVLHAMSGHAGLEIHPSLRGGHPLLLIDEDVVDIIKDFLGRAFPG